PDSIAGVEVVITPAVASAPNGHKTAPIKFEFNLENGAYVKEKVPLLEGVSYSAVVQHPRVHKKTIDAKELEAIPHMGMLDVKLERAMSFRAYIKDSSGNAVVDVAASVNGIKGTQGAGSARSDQHGYFEVGGLAEGDFHVRLFKLSYYELRKDVKVSAIESEVITLTLLGANEIRIRVVDANGGPQAATNVWAVRPASDDPKSPMQYFNLGETDGEGWKVVNFHWIRQYQVTAYKGEQIAYVNFANMRDEPKREFDIRLEPSQKITGKVISATTGVAVGNVDIFATPENGAAIGNTFITRTKGNGTFSITVPVATHSIVVRESRLYLESVQAGISAGQTNVEVRADPKDEVEGNWAEVVTLSAPTKVVAGQEFTATITVHNKGSTTWTTKNRYALGSQAPRDTKRWGPTRVALNHDVGPKSVHTFTVSVKAPAKAGTYNMQWQMVQDGKEWFGQASAILKITVEAASTE
ncbi:MAG: hypothetical protein KDB07_09085, partial [Planctomycetes bacterium]|nr:hypothetical protein [Planctomycetota bacterium]